MTGVRAATVTDVDRVSDVLVRAFHDDPVMSYLFRSDGGRRRKTRSLFAGESKRAIEGAAGTKTLIWPGIDIDIPTNLNNSRCTPKGTKDAVAAAFRAGVPGVVLSRKYSEMRLANLSGAGEAIKGLNFV